MGSKNRKPKIPPPVSMAGAIDERSTMKSEQKRREMMSLAGREGTILTGLGGKKQVLG